MVLFRLLVVGLLDVRLSARLLQRQDGVVVQAGLLGQLGLGLAEEVPGGTGCGVMLKRKTAQILLCSEAQRNA